MFLKDNSSSTSSVRNIHNHLLELGFLHEINKSIITYNPIQSSTFGSNLVVLHSHVVFNALILQLGFKSFDEWFGIRLKTYMWLLYIMAKSSFIISLYKTVLLDFH